MILLIISYPYILVSKNKYLHILDNMDFIGGAVNLAEKVGEVYGDYKTGKAVRLGQYKGSDSVKQLGHYDRSGTNLGIYHG